MQSKDKSIDLLAQALFEGYRSAKRLLESFNRIKALMPITEKQMASISEEESIFLDAFRVRYCDLQDCLGNKIFRTLVIAELESADTMLDVVHKMEKREILLSTLEWKKMRSIRNIFSHDYPADDALRAEALTTAYEQTVELFDIWNRLWKYMQGRFNLDLSKINIISIG